MNEFTRLLRITHSDNCPYADYDCNCGAEIRNRAADEIERLEAELETAKSAYTDLLAKSVDALKDG